MNFMVRIGLKKMVALTIAADHIFALSNSYTNHWYASIVSRGSNIHKVAKPLTLMVCTGLKKKKRKH